MDLEKWKIMKSQIKEAFNKMMEMGYQPEQLRIVFNKNKYENDEFFKNIVLEYENLQENVDFMILPESVKE